MKVAPLVTLARLVRKVGNIRRLPIRREKAAASCAWSTRCMSHAVSSDASNEGDKRGRQQLLWISPDASNEGDKRQRQQLLWKTFFLDHTRWWDNRRQKRSSRAPDFRHKDSREALWLDNCYNPSWVGSQLALLDARADLAEFATAANLSPNNAAQLVGQGCKNHFTPDLVKKLCKQGQVKEAVEVLNILVETSSGFDSYLLYSVLKECVAKKDLMLGDQVHALAVKMGFGSDAYLCDHFIRMYAGHGKLRQAMDVFRGVALPNAFTWSAIISAHTKQGQAGRAIELYQEMRATRAKPDNYVFVAALQACAAAGDLRSGRQVHSQIEEHEFEPDVAVGNSLVNMYAKCGSLRDARMVFDGLREKNVVTWSAMIAGYAQQEGMGQDAFSLYSAMRNDGMVVPNAVTFVCLLQACANMGVPALEKGKQLHSEMKELGVQPDGALGGSLVNMYAKCGSIRDARIVFDGLREKDVVTWNAMIAGYAQQESMGQEALNIYSAMQAEGIAVPDRVTFVCLLHACASMGVSALEEGKVVHSEIIAHGVQSDISVGGSLLNMYAKCGSLEDARMVFDGLREKDVVTWSAMIGGYAQHEGMGQDALSLYSAMRNEGMVVPDAVTFVSLLQACANMGVSALEKGKQVHADIRARGVESDEAVGGSLVNMYAKCGSLRDAIIVFQGLCEKNVVTWSAMIAGYAQQEGMGQDALSLYSAMRKEGMVVPDAVTFVCLLQACANMGVSALEKGKHVHSDIKARGVQSDVAVGGALVNMYAKCGSLGDARIVFDGLSEMNVVTWNAMIAGYAQQEGMGQEALTLYSAMRNEGMVVPDAVTFMCLLQACANIGVSALEQGKQVHSDIIRRGIECDAAVGGSLVNMYAKCGSLRDAGIVFEGLCEKSVVTWNAMIAGYVEQEGMSQDALSLYSAMRSEGMVVPDAVTFLCLLQACANMGVSSLDQGKQIHADINASGVESDVAVGGSLVNMYAKCGSLRDARSVFDELREKSVVTWNAMIAGYAQQEGMGQDALSLYSAMRNEGMLVADSVTFVCLLQACAKMGISALEFGKLVHSDIKAHGVQPDVAVACSLVNMYAKCGSLSNASIVFEGLCEKNVVTWNAMIAGYAQQEGMGQDALSLYSAMRNEGTVPDAVTFVCVLQACVNMGVSALEKGRQVHSDIKARGVQSDVAVGGSLVNMYAKCGSPRDAKIVFDGLGKKSVVTWNAMIAVYAQQEGMGQDALSLYSAMENEDIVVADSLTFVCLLQACGNIGVSALEKGKQVHSDIKARGLQSDVAVGGSLVNMYAKCGSLRDARTIFEGLCDKNVVTWNAMIAGYAQQEGMGQDALSLYSSMRNEFKVVPDAVTFVCLLKACANMGVSAIEKGKQVHSDIKSFGVQSDVAVGGSLVNMYAKCGSLSDARSVFDELCKKSVATWNAMIAGYAQQEGMGQDALSLYTAMQKEGMVVPDSITFVCLLQACANMGVSALEKGKQVHSEIKARGVQSDIAVGNSLVNMYAKCGSLRDARIVFEGLFEKNVVTWNAMIAGYGQQEGMVQDALSLYRAMRNEGMVVPTAVTFVCLLEACANMGVSGLEKGKQVHSDIKACGVESDVAVGGGLVNMYAKCGSLRDARTVFDGLCEKSVVTWSAMIAGYAQLEGMGQDALSLYSAMQNKDLVVPDAVTFVCVLQACANMGVSALEKGKQVHLDIIARGVQFDVAVGGSLVNMYAKCGSLRDARIVFEGLCEKNVVTWNAMIAGYAQLEGMGQEALSLYVAMRSEGIVAPDAVTFVCLLQACASMGISALEKGKQVHSDIKARGVQSDVAVGGSLLNMYTKCGSLRDARIVFDGLYEKSVVTWSAMIAGYAQQEGMGQDALRLYRAMRNEGMVVPDAVTFVCLLKACASVAALQQGKELHSEIREMGLESDAMIGTSLMNMYAQCGRLETARQIFERLPVKKVESWTALINGYAEHGDGGMAIQCFEELLEQGIQPDDVTFICLLTACSRAGLVVEGQEYFDTMEERHGVKPDERHYSCMVDLFGRSGHLGKAEQMLLGASCLAGSVVSWTALLSACKSYGDADLGTRCFEHLVNVQPAVATAYVLLGSIYANVGRWEEVEKVEILRKAAGARKKAAIACIEVKKEVHKFTVGEERSDIAITLRKMSANVKEGGHVPQTQLVLSANVSEQEKEDALCGHAEKLALAYGLVNTPAGSTLLVTKNLRMCDDCHSSTKIMSRVEEREIIVRDGNKVHRFRNGACSCLDKP